ncbi:hypothetical protein EIP91_001556 [Steccherinum ochraceum]|uniref:Uncharacterized protein n=1 Tax=Steccherinum ochraceum TaxID=92696 RepID=A0A4R0RDT5_9APHY|nr:hypothetical protein EIP91_001556 [Steccherinum ochraceum]
MRFSAILANVLAVTVSSVMAIPLRTHEARGFDLLAHDRDLVVARDVFQGISARELGALETRGIFPFKRAKLSNPFKKKPKPGANSAGNTGDAGGGAGPSGSAAPAGNAAPAAGGNAAHTGNAPPAANANSRAPSPSRAPPPYQPTDPNHPNTPSVPRPQTPPPGYRPPSQGFPPTYDSTRPRPQDLDSPAGSDAGGWRPPSAGSSVGSQLPEHGRPRPGAPDHSNPFDSD